MKISALLFVCIIFYNIEAHSQITFGIKGGVNISNLVQSGGKQTNPVNNSYKAGIHAGFQTLIPFSQKIYLTPEFLYNEKGYTDKSIPTHELTLKYLSLPILLGIKLVEKFKICAGVEGSLLLNEDIYEDFDLGLVLGGGFVITSNFQMEFRYTYGLIEILKTSLTDMNGNPMGETVSFHNINFQLSFGYHFD